MAKPKPPLDLASTATSSSSHESASSTTRRRAPYNSPPRPSSNLIALLATVAASSSAADGRPLSPDSRPPDFLCPFLSPRFVPDRPSSSRRTLKVEVAEAAVEEEAEEVYGLSPTPTRLRRVGAAAPNVPDKYVEGDDGRWRKEHSWTLYGSTYCDCATDNSSPESTGPIPEVDDQADPTQLPSASPTSVNTTAPNMTADLPPGWNRAGKKDAPYIPILAVGLAFFICILIFGCVSWRRKRRVAAKDLERKPRKQSVFDDDDSDVEIDEKKRMRAQQRRLWVKATARWRPNVKLAARRRRKRAPSTGDTAYAATSSRRESFADGTRSSETLREDDFPSDVTQPTPSTHESLATSSPNTAATDGETSRADEPQLPFDAPSREEESILPPDYRDGVSGQAQVVSPDPAERLVSAGSTSLFIHATDLPLASDNHVSTAHIATDDKNLLARMAALVSSPPIDDPFVGEDLSHGRAFGSGPSVPVIEELEAVPVAELEATENETGKGAGIVWSNTLSPSTSFLRPSLAASLPVPTYSREPSPHPPLFPPPPSKAQFAAPDFYGYPPTFEHDSPCGDDFHPSAPPSGYPSAPEDDNDIDTNAVPCAPPLIDEEDELQLGLGPSAPPLLLEGAGSSSDRLSHNHHTSSSSPDRTVLSPPDYLP